MSMIDSQLTQAEEVHIATDSLPPRHTKHGKRRQETESSEQDRLDSRNKGKGFYYIQIILYTFLALIAAIIIYYYVNTQNQEASVDKQVADPLESFLEQQAHNGNKPSSGEIIAPDEQQEKDTHEQGQQEGVKEDWPDNKQLVKDTADEVPDIVPTEQKKEYPEQAHTGSSGENERVEEPPQEEVSKPKVKTVHTVQEGETLYSITIQHYKSKDYLDYVAQFNGIKDPTTDVKVGMKIQIPEP